MKAKRHPTLSASLHDPMSGAVANVKKRRSSHPLIHEMTSRPNLLLNKGNASKGVTHKRRKDTCLLILGPALYLQDQAV